MPVNSGGDKAGKAHPAWGGFVPKKRTVTVKQHTRQVAVKPSTAAFGPISGQSKPLQPQRAQAKHAVQKAERALPKRATPAIPYIVNPTQKQVKASTTLAQRAGLLTPAGKQQLRQDPRQAGLLKTVQHYDRVGTRIVHEKGGRAAADLLKPGAGRMLSRAQAVAFGKQLEAATRARYGNGVVPPHTKRSLGLLGISLATVDTTKLATDAAGFLDKHTSINTGDLGPRELFKHAAGDVAALGESPFVGGYQGASVLAAAGLHGNLKPAATFAKGIASGLDKSVPGQLLLHQSLKGANASFHAHPVFAALDLAGAASVAGRAAGALARGAGSTVEAAGVRGALARAGSTVRPPIALTEDAGQAARGYVKQRTYSKDATRKAVQVAQDARREPVVDAAGNVVTIKDRGREVPVLKPKGARGSIAGQPVLKGAQDRKLQNKRADFQASQANSLERYARAEADKTAHEMPKVKGEAAKNIASLITTGTVRSGQHLASDLLKRADQIRRTIETPGAYSTTRELNAAKAMEAQLRAAARDPKVLRQAADIDRLGMAQATALNAGDALKLQHGIHTAAEAERSRLTEYALAHMDATHAEVGGKAAFRTSDGAYLSNEDIAAHALAHGRDPATLAYLPHVEGGIGPRAFHKQFRPGTRPASPGHTRTGSLYLQGRTAFGHQLVREELTNKATAIAKAKAIDKQVHEAAVRHPALDKAKRGVPLTKHEQYVVGKGGYFTAKEAEALSRKLADTGQQFVPIRAHAAKLDAATRKVLQGHQNPAAMETAHERLLSDRLVREGDGHRANSRNVVLMPAHEYNRLLKHLTPANDLEKAVQMLNGPFRMAVLPQPRWLTGNFIEPYLVRLPLKGAGINLPGLAMDVAAAKRYVKVLEQSADPALRDAAKAIRAQQLGGLFVGRRGASVHRTYESFEQGSGAHRALYVAHVLRNLPAVKQLGDLVLAIPKGFFELNRRIEPGAQWQSLGKSVRNDVQQFSGSYLKSVVTTKAMLEEMAKGSVSTATLHRWTHEQHDLLGKYEGFTPVTRRTIQSVAPFLPWSLAAARFVYATLPLQHTAAEAFLLKASQVNQQQWADQHADVPPGSLKVAHVNKDGGLVDYARYTPFALTVPLAEGDTSDLTSSLLPQIAGVQAALQGQDPFGRPLKVKPTAANPKGLPSLADKLGIAFNTAAESTIPLLAQARRLEEKGGTSFGNSTVLHPKVKPNTSHMSAVRRTLDPFRPTYVKASKTAGGAAHSGWGSAPTGSAGGGWGTKPKSGGTAHSGWGG